jgi:hypothetical protein
MFGASKSGKAVAAAVATDPQFNYVTALFNGDGTNGAQNNTFLDSSTNNFTITRNGTPTQGSAAPFGNNWSNYFPSVGDYVSFTDTAFFGTGNFTIECFVFPTASAHNIIMSSTTAANWDLLTYGNQLYWHENGGNLGGSGYGTVPQNQWVHLAASRTGGNLNLYINGTRVYSAANTFNYSASASRLVGPNGGSAAYYASNVRFIKGTGIYSGATITVPTAPLTAVTNTSLLTCQSTYFKDNSANNFTLTASGTPSVQRFSPFLNTASYSPSVNGGAMYFNGSTDYLAGPSNAAFALGTVFTVECWVYPTNTTNLFAIGSLGIGWNGTSWFGISTVGVSWDIYTTTNLPSQNAWSHVAIVRTGTGANQTTVYINGVNVAQGAWTPALTTTVVPYIASGAGGSSSLAGYMSNARIVKGTAVYTANFTPPTSPLTAISGTSLLLNGTNAGIYDSAMITTATTASSAQISTATKKYGTASIYFPSATSSYLASPNSPNYAFNQGRFTIEFWVLTSVGSTAQTVVDTRSTTTSTTGIAIGVNTSTGVFVTVNNVTTNFTGISLVTWQFITVTGNGSSYYVWIDGVYKSGVTYSVSLTDQFLTIGNAISKSTSGLIGYLDDLRITKGYDRYTPTVNFTPPTQSFPTQ